MRLRRITQQERQFRALQVQVVAAPTHCTHNEHQTQNTYSGPKCYAALLDASDADDQCFGTGARGTIQRIKGFKMTEDTSKLLKPAAIVGAVLRDEKVDVNQHLICRNPKKALLFSKEQEKTYRLVYTKRLRCADRVTTVALGTVRTADSPQLFSLNDGGDGAVV